MLRLTALWRALVIAALVMCGSVAVAAPTFALDEDVEVVDEADEAVDPVTDPVTDVTTAEDDDDDFWDWGLLGLLGLLGLAGLFRQPKPVVHDTEPVGTRGTRATRVDDDTTL